MKFDDLRADLQVKALYKLVGEFFVPQSGDTIEGFIDYIKCKENSGDVIFDSNGVMYWREDLTKFRYLTVCHINKAIDECLERGVLSDWDTATTFYEIADKLEGELFTLEGELIM